MPDIGYCNVCAETVDGTVSDHLRIVHPVIGKPVIYKVEEDPETGLWTILSVQWT